MKYECKCLLHYAVVVVVVVVEFPSEYAVSIEAFLPLQQCHMYLVNMSRCLPFENVHGEIARHAGHYYLEKESGSVFYAYPTDGGQIYAVYPYCMVPVSTITDSILTDIVLKF